MIRRVQNNYYKLNQKKRILMKLFLHLVNWRQHCENRRQTFGFSFVVLLIKNQSPTLKHEFVVLIWLYSSRKRINFSKNTTFFIQKIGCLLAQLRWCLQLMLENQRGSFCFFVDINEVSRLIAIWLDNILGTTANCRDHVIISIQVCRFDNSFDTLFFRVIVKEPIEISLVLPNTMYCSP